MHILLDASQMSFKFVVHPFYYARNMTFNFSHFNVYTPHRRQATPNVPTVLMPSKKQVPLFLFNFKHKTRSNATRIL